MDLSKLFKGMKTFFKPKDTSVPNTDEENIESCIDDAVNPEVLETSCEEQETDSENIFEQEIEEVQTENEPCDKIE